jgi:hypothetical protein
MAIKSKNKAKIFLGGGHITKIRTKYIYIYIYFTSNFFFLILGGTMAHPGPPLPPSLTSAISDLFRFYMSKKFMLTMSIKQRWM